jgi:organic hydroperoxide reductase OsmC/OhrA
MHGSMLDEPFRLCNPLRLRLDASTAHPDEVLSVGNYRATIEWQRGDARFVDQRYSRAHRWQFDEGLEVPASASPQLVPMSVAAAVDPEEAFVASLASCHMLWFLSLAAKDGLCVDHYHDAAEGEMRAGVDGKIAMSRVTLHPAVRFTADDSPAASVVLAMHESAHEQCFIARSVKTEVRCEPVFSFGGTASNP